MAEIRIEKKKPIWPWILLGIIILGLLLYFFVFRDRMNNQQNVDNTRDTTITNTNGMAVGGGAVAAYIALVREDTAKMSKDHEYSHEALTKLAAATDEIANKTGVDVKANLDEVKQLSQNITDNPNATTHADDIKKASSIIATALATIQKAKFADLNSDSEKLTSDAAAIDTKDLTLDQKGTVKTFYDSAANLLEKMNNHQ